MTPFSIMAAARRSLARVPSTKLLRRADAGGKRKVRMAAALAAVLVAAAAAAVAMTRPAHGQTVARAAKAPQAVQLLTGGGRIGMSIRDVNEDDVKRERLAGLYGVVVEDVRSNSPAEQAGFRKGDIVIEFDGERVRSTRQFVRLVQETPAGRTVQATVVRDGQKSTLSVEPREDDAARIEMLRDLPRTFRFERPAPPAPPAAPAPPFSRIMPDIEQLLRPGGGLGITVSDLSPQLAEYFGTKDGVLVTSVYDDSAAAKAGLKAGDVITSFNGRSVTNPADVRRETQRLASGAEFTLEIVRDKKSTTLKGKMEERQVRRRTVRTVV